MKPSNPQRPKWAKLFEEGRKNVNITQTEAAKLCNVRLTTFQKYERGVRVPPVWLFYRFCQVTGIPFRNIISFLPEKTIIDVVKYFPNMDDFHFEQYVRELNEIRQETERRERELAVKFASAVPEYKEREWAKEGLDVNELKRKRIEYALSQFL